MAKTNRGPNGTHKRKLSELLDKDPIDSRFIRLTIRGPTWMMVNPIENITVRRNLTWTECLEKVANLKITPALEANYMVRPRFNDPSNVYYSETLDSEIGELADTYCANKQFLSVVICKKVLPDEDNQQEYIRSEAKQTIIERPSPVNVKIAKEVSKKESRTYAAGSKVWEKPRLSQSLPKDKPNRRSCVVGGDGGNRKVDLDLLELTALAKKLQLPLQLAEQPVEVINLSKRGDSRSKVCVKVGNEMFTAEGRDFNSAKNRAVTTALEKMRKLKHKIDLAKTLQTDAEQSLAAANDHNVVSIVSELASKRGLIPKFDTLKREGHRQKEKMTVAMTFGYSFEATGYSEMASRKAAAKAALLAFAGREPDQGRYFDSTGVGTTVKSSDTWKTASGIMVELHGGGRASSSINVPDSGNARSLKTPGPKLVSGREGIDKLAYLSKLLKISVSYSDFPNNHGYLSVVSFNTKLPNAAHGYGDTLVDAQNAAALKLLEELPKAGR